jgi:urea carboxylase-associated protein 2
MTNINDDLDVLYTDIIAPSAHWSLLVRRGVTLRLTDLEGGANVGMLMYNPQEKLERYNAPDTLKCQHTFKLTQGHCLYSDMGRIFCSIVHDTVGWHDTIGGYLSDQALAEKYTLRSYQEGRNDWTLSGEHSFLVELAKYELGVRDISANLNIFSKVVADEQGQLKYQNGNSQAGDSVALRFEMDTLVILHTCPHPMNPQSDYPRKAIQYELCKSPAIQDDDECMNACDQNQRGFKNTALYHLQGA